MFSTYPSAQFAGTRPSPKDVQKDADTSREEVAYYKDVARDRRNLAVTTLHRPGRPRYTVCAKPLGATRGPRGKTRRYWRVVLAGTSDVDELARWDAALDSKPRDEELWLRYIEYRGRAGPAAAFAAAERALLTCGDRRALRARRFDAAADHLPAHDYRDLVRAALAADDGRDCRELWARALGAAVRSGGPEEVRDTAAEAARAVGASAVFAYGAYLRAAGRWETLVLLVELLASAHFPLAEARDDPAEAERTLAEYEARVSGGGLPTGVAWSRVERARAAVRWRPGAGCAEDPERAPAAAEVVEVVRGAMCWRGGLAAAALLLAKVPLLPGTEAALAGLHGRAVAQLEWTEPADVAVLPLLWARAESGAGWAGAEAEAAADWLRELVRPPHYFGEAPGFLSWIERLWDAAVRAAACEEERSALLCWRMRWAALAAGLGLRGARAGARRAARAGGAAVLADLAALEEGARREMVLRAAWEAAPARSPAALYAARRLGRAELAAAALGLCPAPASDDPEHIRAAYQECCRRCNEIEREIVAHDCDEEGGGDDEAEGLWGALLPHEGEWARARALLGARGARVGVPGARGARARRWREACAEAAVCAIGGAGGAARARELLPLHPRNATLAYFAGRAPAWCGGPRSGCGGAGAGALGALVRAPLCPRVARRACSAAPLSAAVWGARLLAERRAGSVAGALASALAGAPHDKWVLMEGAAAGQDVDALAERALCRGLRLYALPLELRPLSD